MSLFVLNFPMLKKKIKSRNPDSRDDTQFCPVVMLRYGKFENIKYYKESNSVIGMHRLLGSTSLSNLCFFPPLRVNTRLTGSDEMIPLQDMEQ